MNTLRRLSLLSPNERRLLIKAALLLVTIRLGTLLLPFTTVKRLLARFSSPPARLSQEEAHRIPAERVSWAVQVASRYTPKERSCLTEALTAQLLLTRRGYPALLHIGVARGEWGTFQAHAWVESGGKILTGEPGHERFAPLAVLKGEDF